MTTIYKYRLKIQDEQTVMLPNGRQIALVGLDPKGAPCIWAFFDPDLGASEAKIYIVGTGHPIPDKVQRHIGSFVHDCFVWHVFL